MAGTDTAGRVPTNPEELTCRELVELVTDYLEGALPPVEAARFEAHLDDCDGCPMYVDQFRTTIYLVGRLEEADVSPNARVTLLREFRAWHRSRT